MAAPVPAAPADPRVPRSFTARRFTADQTRSKGGTTVRLQVLPTGLRELLAEADKAEAEGQFLPFSQMASYDVGGALGRSGMNSLLVSLKATTIGGASTVIHYGTAEADTIVGLMAENERLRVSESSLSSASPTRAVLDALDAGSHERDDDEILALHGFFKDSMLFNDISRLRQLACCRYFKRVSLSRFEVLFEQGDFGDRFFTIVSGKVSMLINGHEVRQKGQGEYFGEVALQGSHQRNATVIAIEEPTELATLSRADYLRVFGNLDEMVWPILDILPSERTRMQLQLVYDYFEHVGFLRDIPYPLLKQEVCRVMTRVWFAHGQTIYKQGAVGAALYIVGDGVVHMVQQAHSSPSTGQLERIATRKTALHGTCFGQEALQIDDHQRSFTAIADATSTEGRSEGRCMCAALSLEGFTSACQVVGSAAVRVLRRPPRMRKDHHLQMLLHMFEDSALFKQDLRLVGLRMNVCRFLGVELLEAGKTLFEQGDLGEKFYVIMMGCLKVFVDGKLVTRRLAGESIGDLALTSMKTRRNATIRADGPCILATLSRGDHGRVMKMDMVHSALDKFWKAFTDPIVPNVRVIDFDSYRQLHLRIMKTCLPKKTFNQQTAEEASARDWKEDLATHAHNSGKTLEVLSYNGFCDSLYMLVDDWSEGVGTAELFMEFLDTVYNNIADNAGKLKALAAVKSRSKVLATKQSEGIKKGVEAERFSALQNEAGNVQGTEYLLANGALEHFADAVMTGARKSARKKARSAGAFLIAANAIRQTKLMAGVATGAPEKTASPSLKLEFPDRFSDADLSRAGEIAAGGGYDPEQAQANQKDGGVQRDSADRWTDAKPSRPRAVWGLLRSATRVSRLLRSSTTAQSVSRSESDSSDSENDEDDSSTSGSRQLLLVDETGARAAAEVVEVGETLAVHSRTVHCSTSWAGAGYTGHTIWDGANLATTPVGPQGAQAAGGNVTVSKLLPSVPGELKQLYVNALEMKQRNVARLAQTPVENSIGLQSNETALQETESETDTGTAQQAVLAPQPETPRPGTEAAGREVVPSTSRATVRYTSVVGSQGGPGSARHVRLPAQPQAPSHNSNSVEMSSQDRMPELRYKVLKMTLEVPAEWKGVEELLVASHASLRRIVVPQLAASMNVQSGDIVVSALSARVASAPSPPQRRSPVFHTKRVAVPNRHRRAPQSPGSQPKSPRSRIAASGLAAVGRDQCQQCPPSQGHPGMRPGGAIRSRTLPRKSTQADPAPPPPHPPDASRRRLFRPGSHLRAAPKLGQWAPAAFVPTNRNLDETGRDWSPMSSRPNSRSSTASRSTFAPSAGHDDSGGVNNEAGGDSPRPTKVASATGPHPLRARPSSAPARAFRRVSRPPAAETAAAVGATGSWTMVGFRI